MKALIYYGNNDIRLEKNWDDPSLENNTDAIIKINYTSICATDIEEWQYGPNYIQLKDLPIVHGHEITGEVIDIGKNVKNLSIGDTVAVNNVIHCNKCFWCLNGQGGACSGMKVAGFALDGGLAEFMKWPSSNLIKISDDIPKKYGAFIEPSTVATHAVRKSGVRPGDKVAVFGCGTVGLLTLQVLKASGAIVTALDIKKESLDLAKLFGADYTYDTSKKDLIDYLLSITSGIGHDIVFETAGSQISPKISIDITRRGGKTILAGIYAKELSMNFNDIVFTEKEVIGTVGSSPGDMEAAVMLLNQGKIDPSSLVSGTIKLDNVIKDGYEKMNSKAKNIFRILVSP